MELWFQSFSKFIQTQMEFVICFLYFLLLKWALLKLIFARAKNLSFFNPPPFTLMCRDFTNANVPFLICWSFYVQNIPLRSRWLLFSFTLNEKFILSTDFRSHFAWAWTTLLALNWEYGRRKLWAKSFHFLLNFYKSLESIFPFFHDCAKNENWDFIFFVVVNDF